LAEAKETQADVELLITHDRPRTAVNRIVKEMYEEMKEFNSAINPHCSFFGAF
jgi:hypothetical protein